MIKYSNARALETLLELDRKKMYERYDSLQKAYKESSEQFEKYRKRVLDLEDAKKNEEKQA